MEKVPISVSILEKLKAIFQKKGSKVISGLSRLFKVTEITGKGRRGEIIPFLEGLSLQGIEITKEESSDIINLLDTDQDNLINFDKFLYIIIGKPNIRRQSIIDKAFLKIDKDCLGFLTPKEIKMVYNFQNHPHVKLGQKNEEEVFKDFMQNFGGKSDEDKIFRIEWNDYYSAVSSYIDNDDHFILLMKNAWKLD